MTMMILKTQRLSNKKRRGLLHSTPPRKLKTTNKRNR
jgi:hypothetical protein